MPAEYADADIVKLDNGTYLLYFGVEPETTDNQFEIYVATSTDGIAWTRYPDGLTGFAVEDGVRIEPINKLDTDGVAAPTVVVRPDGTYYMVFRAAVPRRYTPNSFNRTTTVLIGATSSDGLSWERQGVVVNGRHAIYDGYIDGPELFYNPAGKLRLRYWAPGGMNAGAIIGQFEKKSKNDGGTWRKRELMFNDILGGDPYV